VGERAFENSGEFYSRFKLRMGEMDLLTSKPFADSSEEVSLRPEIIAARVMWELYERARKVNNPDLPKHSDVTVTVPAEWNAQQREATITAAKIAGFKNVMLIEEPVAAYLTLVDCEIDQALTRAKNVLVFDYGGGTLDITVIHNPDDQSLPYVVGRSMEKDDIGGEYIDRLLCRELVAGEAEWLGLSPRDRLRLADITRQLKETLNPRNLTLQPILEATWKEPVDLSDSAQYYEPGQLVLSYDEMRDLLGPIVDTVEKHILNALKCARQLSHEDIDAVIMVGGSSYLRVVKERILQMFPGKDFDHGIYLYEPEKLVAIGAALYQSSFDRGEKKRFQLRVPMRTYIEYPSNGDIDGAVKTKVLGDVKDPLPLKPKAPPTCKIPQGTEEIKWKVKQEHTYASKPPDVVEEVRFEGYSGRADRLRLEYEIDLNGRFVNWNPSLIIRQTQKLVTGTLRQYDWLDIDYTELANKYTIHVPDPLSEF
jgi:molecular chaperone DnaK (HSP70)